MRKIVAILVLLAARLVIAASHGLFFGVALIIATQLVPKHRQASAVSFVIAGISVANVLGVPIGTAIGNAYGWRAPFWAIAVAGVVATVALAALTPATTTKERQHPLSMMAEIRAVGLAGCASAACHGSPVSTSLTGKPDDLAWCSAATHCMATDPHMKAFEVLKGALATRIMEGLKEKRSATEDVRCLACHTNPSLATASTAYEKQLMQDGIGCEGCHGNSQRWLREHTID